MEQKKKSHIVKSKKLWKTIGIILVLIITYSIGSSSAKTTLNDEKVTYDDIQSKVLEAEKELEEVTSKLDDKQNEYDKVKKLIDQKEDVEKELTDLKSKKEEHKSEVKSLKTTIKDKKSELKSLEGDILEAKGKPINLIAGEWIVGEDVPTGRYEASGSSNFVVRDEYGGLKVNTILGGGTVGRGNYVFFAEDGDVIKAAAQVTLTPVE